VNNFRQTISLAAMQTLNSQIPHPKPSEKNSTEERPRSASATISEHQAPRGIRRDLLVEPPVVVTKESSIFSEMRIEVKFQAMLKGELLAKVQGSFPFFILVKNKNK
jgi:hypothetical protein